ncbi:MAG: M28 family peptidase [Candidatus Lokiarchaeota archaeon]|nr:M28 family peptidase [Candidatus Lokiarchaeota archaeon]
MTKSNDNYKDYMYNFMVKICKEIGPRIGWSENERKAAYMVRNELENYCDEVEIETFRYTRSFYMMFRIPIILNIVGVFLYILTFFGLGYNINSILSIISVACFSLSLIFLIGQYIFNIDIMSIFAPSGQSQNVVGKIKPKNMGAPSGERKILIFSGHHDSTWHFPLMDKFKEKFILFMYVTIFFLFGSLIISIINLIWILFAIPFNGILDLITRILYIGCILFLGIFSIFMIDRNRPTLGAKDNLSGVVTILGLGKYLAENGRPDNVEVWCVSFGSEEGGLHGSKAFVKEHLTELKNAIAINADTVGEGKIRIAKTELLTKHDPRAIELIDTAANNLNISHSIIGSGGGRTDAWSFTEKEIPAATMIALKDGRKMPDNYHTVRDIPENVDQILLKQALEINIEIIRVIDNDEFEI